MRQYEIQILGQKVSSPEQAVVDDLHGASDIDCKLFDQNCVGNMSSILDWMVAAIFAAVCFENSSTRFVKDLG